MLKQILLSDYKRCGFSKLNLWILIKIFIVMPNPGLKFMTIFRLTQHFRKKNRLLFYFFFLWLRRLKVKYGFDISYRTQIGNGFYIGHFGGVVIHGDTIIGNNCNISQGITFGVSNSGSNIGVPKIGNSVFIGPGACIFGAVTIGDQVTIGANVVITENVPDNHTVTASKISIINKDLSKFYIHNSAK